MTDVPTPAGISVAVLLGRGATIRFDNVLCAGRTFWDTSRTAPKDAPAGFSFPPGAPHLEVKTTAVHTQSCLVSLPVPDGVDTSRVRMLALDEPFEDWIDITVGEVYTPPNPGGLHIMGWTPKNSFFAVALAPDSYVPKRIELTTVDGSLRFSSGRVAGLKARLVTADGNPIPDPDVVLKLYVAGCLGGLLGEIQPHNQFDWNSQSERYLLRLDTSTLSPGTWQLMAVGGQAYGETVITVA